MRAREPGMIDQCVPVSTFNNCRFGRELSAVRPTATQVVAPSFEPTREQLVFVEQATETRFTGTPGSAIGTLDHVAPSHRAVIVPAPTARQLVAVGQATHRRKPLPSGNGMMDQLAPFQCSASGLAPEPVV